MNLLRRMNISSLIALLVVCFWPYFIMAQDITSYEGKLTLGDYEGSAAYNYQKVDNDSLLTGVFSFESIGADTMLTKPSSFVSVLGNFESGTPKGWWEFHMGKYKSTGITTLVNNHYQLDLSGERHLVRGRMANGQPEGEWVNIVEVLDNSEVIRTPFRSSIVFANGIPQKSFRIGNEQTTLVGRFLRNGLAHDTWELYGRDNAGAIESWEFREGSLSKIRFSESGDGLEIIFPQPQQQNTRLVTIDDHYMQAVRLMIRINQDPNQRIQSKVFDLLRENTTYYEKIASLFTELGYASFTPEFKVRIPYIPLTKTEIDQLDSIRSLTIQSNEWNQLLSQDTQLQIMALADNQVEFLLTVNNYLEREILQPLTQLLDFHDEDILANASRAEVLRILGLTEKISGPLMIKVGEDSLQQTFQGPVISLERNQTALSIAFQQAVYAYQSLDSIGKVLDKSLSSHKREQRLAELEQELIQTSNQLHEHADTVVLSLNQSLTTAVRQVERTAREHLEVYSNSPSNDKIPRAEALITCFEELDELILVMARQPLQWEKIQEAYTDEVWNPFTYTVMEEQIKRRILDAYQEVLLPDFLNQIENGIECEKANSFIYQVESVHKRMFEMVSEDTKRLERKLKREDNPKSVLRLFGVETVKEESP